MRKQNKPVCAVLGVGPGNGTAIAQRFSQGGAAVALMARNRERLLHLAESIPDSQGFPCNCADPQSIHEAFAAVRAELGPVTTLVFNAGNGVWGDVLSIKPEDFEATWRTNAFGSFLAAREVLPPMLEVGAGNIIFVGATASRRGGVVTAAFAPAKAAQKSLAESLARSYGPKGIHVALVVIDAVVDEPNMRARLSDKPEDFFSKPKDIAETIFMVASQARSAWTFELEVRPFGEKW